MTTAVQLAEDNKAAATTPDRLVDRLWYFAPAHPGFPNKTANNVQMMKVCQGLADAGQPTTLVVPGRPDTAARLRAAGDLRLMYGLSRDVAIELCAFPYPFTFLQQGLYAPLAAVRARRRHARVAYARHDWTAAGLCAVGIPVICELHHFRPSAASRYLFREASRGRPVAFVSISGALANQLVAGGCPPSALLVAHDAVDLERFTPPVDRAVARTRLGLTDRPTVCHVGHLYPGRGVETLLECAGRLPDVLFLFVGGTAADVERHRAAALAGGLSNVRFEGDVPNADVPLYLFAADALAMPYTSGTLTHQCMSPMKLFEYLAAGRPIISSDFPVLHEVLTPGRDALFVPPADAGAFAAAITRVLADDELARRMGQCGRQTATRYTWIERQRTVLAFARSRFGPGRLPRAGLVEPGP